MLKPFAAVGTDERSEVGVSSHVRVQVGRPVEGLFADDTDVGFDGGVRQAVTRQVARLAEGARADFTLEWLLPSVNPL